MPTRTYIYNPGDLQHLFAKIIESLSLPELPDDLIQRILSEICHHFRFGCGFVYESDHTRTFHLKERLTLYKSHNLPDSFREARHFNRTILEELQSQAFFYQHVEENHATDAMFRIFNSNTFMLVPVFNQDRAVIGLVGMMDRRRNILLDEKAVQAAKMVLNLLANNVKLRIYQRSLEYAERSLVGILDNAGIDVYVNDFNTHEILYANKSMAAPYGGLKNMLGKKCWQALYTDKTGQCDYCPQKKLIDENGNPTKVYSWDYRRPFDGSWFRVLSAAFHWVDGRLAHVVSSVDITENKNNEATIVRLANYDPLTNLPNRRKLMANCEEALRNAALGGKSGYLLFFDLDNFKKLNDSVGHQAGDELLAAIGKDLMQNPLTRNNCYRYGGDEFVLLYPNAKRKHILQVAAYLLGRFNQPWQLASTSPVCRASIGIADYPNHGDTPDTLFHNADQMMYKAKQIGRGAACFIDGETVRPG